MFSRKWTAGAQTHDVCTIHSIHAVNFPTKTIYCPFGRKDKGIRFVGNQDPSVLASPKVSLRLFRQWRTVQSSLETSSLDLRYHTWTHRRWLSFELTRESNPSTGDWHFLPVTMGWALDTVRWWGEQEARENGTGNGPGRSTISTVFSFGINLWRGGIRCCFTSGVELWRHSTANTTTRH